MSTTNRIRSASVIAVSICRSTSSLRSSRSTMPTPPVSISSKNRAWSSSPSCTSEPTRSRVTPAMSSTMAIRRPASQLNRDDLPTFGRPTITTLGNAMTNTPRESSSDAACEVAVGSRQERPSERSSQGPVAHVVRFAGFLHYVFEDPSNPRIVRCYARFRQIQGWTRTAFASERGRSTVERQGERAWMRKTRAGG